MRQSIRFAACKCTWLWDAIISTGTKISKEHLGESTTWRIEAGLSYRVTNKTLTGCILGPSINHTLFVIKSVLPKLQNLTWGQRHWFLLKLIVLFYSTQQTTLQHIIQKCHIGFFFSSIQISNCNKQQFVVIVAFIKGHSIQDTIHSSKAKMMEPKREPGFLQHISS